MSDKTVREDQNATVREEQNAAETIREGQTPTGSGGVGVGSVFLGYHVVRQLPTKGSEADIFVVKKDSAQYILKLYRYGIKPKRDILLAIKALSESHPHEFIRLFDADFDAASGRWYEIQEYVANGSLQTLMADRSLLTGAQQATFFNDVARELADALHALHQNNLLHLDLKPSNILLRSVHPLDLVLIDFGIATALDSDMSKKVTKMRGTPMYQSPESYSGVMGRPADWWGLGMILLEIAAGVHPFRGLSERVISYAIATEPVEIPESLNAGQKELLRGLLTRTPEKRWNYEQVSRWLSGERGIPQHFENFPEVNEQPSSNGTARNPIKFMGNQYQNLADLATAFLKDEQSWKKGREFLLRGYVKQWLESNKEFDTIVDMDDAMSGTEDPDEKLFRFTQRFGENVPFAFGGHLITLENLLLFAGKVLKRQPVTAMQQKIADSIENGALLSCLDFYKQQRQVSGTIQDLGLVLESLKGRTQESLIDFLDFYVHLGDYYCPFLENTATVQDIIKKFFSLSCAPMTMERWNQINARYIVPGDILSQMRSSSSYHQALSRLNEFEQKRKLVPRDRYTGEEAQKLQYVLSYLDEDKWSEEFFDFCLHPENYYCPFLKGNRAIENVVREASALRNVPVAIAHWNDLNSKFFIPSNIVEQMQLASPYHQTLLHLYELEQKGKLVPRNRYTAEEAQKLQYILSYLDEDKWSEEFLDFCLHPENYYCPFLKGNRAIENVVREASALRNVPVAIAHWNDLNSKFFIPSNIVEQLLSALSYHQALSNLDELERKGKLVPRNRYTAEEAQKLQYILSYLDEGKWSENFLDFCLHPENYYCPFLKGNRAIENVVREASALRNVPMAIARWNDLNSKFFIPSNIVEQLHSALSYHQALSRLNELEKKGKLVPRDHYTAEEEQKVQYVLPYLDEDKLSEEFLDFCLHPENYYCPFLNKNTTVDNIIKEIPKLHCVPIKIDYFNKIKSIVNFIPQDIICNMRSSSSYNEGILLLDNIKNSIENNSLSIYDIRIIDEFMMNNRFVDDAEIKIEYISLIKNKEIPLLPEDRKLLEHIYTVSSYDIYSRCYNIVANRKISKESSGALIASINEFVDVKRDSLLIIPIIITGLLYLVIYFTMVIKFEVNFFLSFFASLFISMPILGILCLITNIISYIRYPTITEKDIL